MLNLTAHDGTSFTLDVVAYQFQDLRNIEDNGWDSEWLLISGSASAAGRSWKFRDPCLTTFELEELAKWFRDFGRSGTPTQISFTEPNLTFERTSDGSALLLIRLAQECAPPWATDAERFGDGVCLQLPVSAIDAGATFRTLNDLVTRYPRRSQ